MRLLGRSLVAPVPNMSTNWGLIVSDWLGGFDGENRNLRRISHDLRSNVVPMFVCTQALPKSEPVFVECQHSRFEKGISAGLLCVRPSCHLPHTVQSPSRKGESRSINTESHSAGSAKEGSLDLDQKPPKVCKRNTVVSQGREIKSCIHGFSSTHIIG